MSIYSVHIKGSSDEPSTFERAVFVREGFNWWAFILGPIWLVWNRAWLALLAWILLQFILGFLVQAYFMHVMAQTIVDLIVALALGFEAATLRRYVLTRRGFLLIDIVQESHLAEAERRFFARRILQNSRPATNPPSSSAMSGFVGLFPSSGA